MIRYLIWNKSFSLRTKYSVGYPFLQWHLQTTTEVATLEKAPRGDKKMAKKLKTTNKPDAPIKDDGREKMYQGSYKDDVYKDDPEKQEAAGTEEATQQEPQGFMDSNKKKSKKKTMWQESKDRIYQQQYRSTYGSSVHYNAGKRNYRKGM